MKKTETTLKMKLYFNYTQCFIIAQRDGIAIDMRTGKQTDAKCQSRLNSYDKSTTSKWIPLQDMGDLYDLSDSDVTVTNGVINMTIDGHPITAIHKRINGVSHVQLTGNFPRYFWKGLSNLISQ